MMPFHYYLSLRRVIAALMLLLTAATLAMAATETAGPPVRIAVLAFRPAQDVQTRWQPLIDYLDEKLPGNHFQIDAMGYKELETAIAQKRVDFVLTNPAHYILMTYRNGLSSPLATLVPIEKGRTLAKFGGVIIARADRTDINTLEDLRGKRIAAVTKGSLGGYQAQALELAQAGIKIPDDVTLVELGMPHDLAVNAVMDGQADAGFVRTGVLEDMGSEGKLDLARIKVIAPKSEPGFPLLHSTRLYPEWPFSAMPGVDENLAQQVATLLLSIPHGGELAKRLDIHGFTIPTDYESVRATLETLRLPPFDTVPKFTLRDIWKKYRWELVIGLLLIAMIGLLSAWLLVLNRKLLEGRQRLQDAAREWHHLLTALGEGVYGVDANGHCTFINPAALAMLGFSLDEILGRDQHLLFHHHHEDGSHYPQEACPISLTLQDGIARNWEDWFWRKDGTGFPVMLTTSPIQELGKQKGTVVVFRNISAQRELERQLRKEATTDPLTGVANRRFFQQQLGMEWGRFKRFGEPVSVLMADIDYFKRVNDTYGHATGDLVLNHFTEVSRRCLRSVDLIGRLGGEEFGIMLPVTDSVEALAFAERLRRMVADTPAMTPHGEIAFTVSIGVSEFDVSDDIPDTALARADTALYRAKEGGRNLVEVFVTDVSRTSPSLGRSFVQLKWKENYACGERTIDAEHQQLFCLANELFDKAAVPDAKSENVNAAFDVLLAHVADHFRHEEAILLARGYAGLDEHRKLHQQLVERASQLRQQARSVSLPLGVLVEFLVSEVVVDHMLQEDTKFFGIFNKESQ